MRVVGFWLAVDPDLGLLLCVFFIYLLLVVLFIWVLVLVWCCFWCCEVLDLVLFLDFFSKVVSGGGFMVLPA